MLHHVHPSGVVAAIEEVWDMAEEQKQDLAAAASP